MNISSTTYFWNILFNRKKPTIFKYLVSDIQYYGILQMHSIEKKNVVFIEILLNISMKQKSFLTRWHGCKNIIVDF